MAAVRKFARLHAAEPHANTRTQRQGDGSYKAAVADELAGAVERVLNTRYAGADSPTAQSAPLPRGSRQAIKSKSPSVSWVAAPSVVCLSAVILYALLVAFPWLTHISSVDRLLNL
jgi:hypothetical protein